MNTRRLLPLPLLLLSLSLLSLSLPVYARVKLQFDVTDGATSVLSRVTGSAVSVVKTCPGASVALRITGTSTAVTFYTDAAGSNPATTTNANSAGRVAIWVDDGVYDIVMSGGGCSSHTWSAIAVRDDDITVSVLGFGAKCDIGSGGSTDDTAAFQRAFDFSGPHVVTIPAGKTCKTTDEVRIGQDRVNIWGGGQQSSKILFVPTANDKSALRVGSISGNPIYQNQIKDLTIYSTDTTYRKFAIRQDRASRTLIENVAVSGWNGGADISPFVGGSSTALYLRGWEFGWYRNLTLSADIPIRIGTNAGDANLSIDVTHFLNVDVTTHLTAGKTTPCIWIEDGVNLFDTRFDGFHCAGGKYGVYNVQTTGSGASQHLSFHGGRNEQASDATGWDFYFDRSTTSLNGLTIQDYAGGTRNGIYARNVDRINLIGYDFQSTSLVGLNVDTTVDRVLCSSCRFNSGSTVVTTGMTEVYGAGFASSTYPLPTDFLLENNSNLTSGKAYRIGGVYQNCVAPTALGNGNQLSLKTLSGSVAQSRVVILYKGATKEGSFAVYFDGSGAAIESTTDTWKSSAETDIGNVAGKITVFWQSAAAVSIFNQLGESVNVSYCQMLN